MYYYYDCYYYYTFHTLMQFVCYLISFLSGQGGAKSPSSSRLEIYRDDSR